MKYIDPSVKLIRSMDSRAEAWINSRPYLDHSAAENDIRDVEKMDLPIGGFVQHHFEINSSLFFRDLLFTLRPIVPWARSQRTVPLTQDNCNISSEYESQHEFNKTLVDNVLAKLAAGVPQDFAKKELPMSFRTDYTVSIDDRTLVNFLNSLRIHNKRLFGVYGKLFLDALGKDETYLDRRMKDIFPSYSLTEQEMKATDNGGEYTEVLDSVVLATTIQLNLFSQFIRQHYSNVKSEIWNWLAEDLDLGLSCTDRISVVLYARKSAFDKVISARTCFFGMWDNTDDGSWNHIIAPVINSRTVEEFKAGLPCRGDCTQCTIKSDMIPRAKLIEVNPPCPILIEDPCTVEIRKAKYNPTSAVFKKWEEVAQGITVNEGNEVRKIYFDALHDRLGLDAEGFDVNSIIAGKQ